MNSVPPQIATDAATPRFGKCSGCGERFQLGGNQKLGFKIPAHNSKDLRDAVRNINCSGSDKEPSQVFTL